MSILTVVEGTSQVAVMYKLLIEFEIADLRKDIAK